MLLEHRGTQGSAEQRAAERDDADNDAAADNDDDADDVAATATATAAVGAGAASAAASAAAKATALAARSREAGDDIATRGGGDAPPTLRFFPFLLLLTLSLRRREEKRSEKQIHRFVTPSVIFFSSLLLGESCLSLLTLLHRCCGRLLSSLAVSTSLFPSLRSLADERVPLCALGASVTRCL